MLTASLEIVERFSPIPGFRHAYVLPHGGFVARAVLWWRPAAPGCAALAITTGPMVATRCARLRRAGDHHVL
ncbi:MAG: hypothetical protein EPN51_00945 [Mycobacterium sp.]|nr:MAG: hypothetical protein EPN51_00945 [Mycobacterium sp.]